MTTSDAPTVDTCPNCGAPLKLDNAGDCVWCHAHVHVTATPVLSADRMDAATAARVLFGNVLDDEPDDIELLQPVSNLLIFLSTTGQEEAVQDFLSHWEHKDAVGPLLEATRAAGARVTVSAKASRGFDEFADHSSLYTAGEWWMISLACDLLALVAGVPGVDPMQALDSKHQAQEIRDSYRGKIAGATPPEGEASSPLLAMRGAVPGDAAAPGDPPAGGDAGEPGGRHHLFRRHRDR